MTYENKWDNFLDYMMKNHDIHENKNVCPEFNGEKMHEHFAITAKINYRKKGKFVYHSSVFALQ